MTGVWHSVLSRNALDMTYCSLDLHRRGVCCLAGTCIPDELAGKLAPTWQLVYWECVGKVIQGYEPEAAIPHSPPVDSWAAPRLKRSMLLFLQHRRRPEAQQPPEVWRVFWQLVLPKWDLDFIRRVLWRKLPLGVRMERLGENFVTWTGGGKTMCTCCKIVTSVRLCLIRCTKHLVW